MRMSRLDNAADATDENNNARRRNAPARDNPRESRAEQRAEPVERVSRAPEGEAAPREPVRALKYAESCGEGRPARVLPKRRT